MAPFNCTRHIVTDSLLLWQPTIIWQSGYMISENSDANRATIFSDGYVSLYHTGEITTICFSDLAMFPFDTQRCKIVLEIHSLRSEALKLHPLQPIAFYKTQGIMWVEHKIWEVLDNKTDIVEIPANYHYGELWEERRQLIIFTMLIRRRPMYYFVNIIIPCLVIAAVEIVVFLVRITSFEKTNVSIMCLLAYTMVEVQIMKEAPKGSAEIPLLSIYIVLQMAYIGLLAITAENIVLVIVKRSRRKDQVCI